MAHDYDWLVIGSGFGGSVSALRLREKGYSVGVLECGRRFADDELPRSTWDVRRYFWAPRLGMRGIFRLTIFKHVTIASGAGVGGGSLGYANTLYRARRRFYEDPQWAGLADWEAALAPHYDEAERMLGVVAYDEDDHADDLLREYAREIGVEDTYAKTRVGVFLGERGRTVPDPYFGGDGPDRTGCLRCGRCMVGCPHGAKNTLVKNYLWLAERAGAEVRARADGGRRAAARRAGRLGGLRGRDRAAGRVAAQAPADVHGARRGARRRGARHQPAARRRRRCRGSRTASASWCARTRRRSSPSRSRPARRTSRAAWRSPDRSTPTPTRTSRRSSTARPGTR